MLYKITAHINKENIKEFYAKLTDDSIASLEPDGQEMLASMQRAIIDTDKIVTWYENCFCAVPLNHERTTVYDHYFDTFSPLLVDEIKKDLEGSSFWEYMEKQ